MSLVVDSVEGQGDVLSSLCLHFSELCIVAKTLQHLGH